MPGKLRDLVTNALAGVQDLQPMLTDTVRPHRLVQPLHPGDRTHPD